LGVLIPLSEKAKEAEKQANALVSWVRPPRKYNLAAGGDEPWVSTVRDSDTIMTIAYIL
jgi:hypothetical protein